MRLQTEPYLQQREQWPRSGPHILAQYDEESIIVYQAYRPEIGLFAAQHKYFGGVFSYSRMSWIKPNFLWMMYRSGWGTKPDQEITLAVWLKRSFFDNLLQMAVKSSFDPTDFATKEEWHRSVAKSDVRLQWDPDHGPHGEKLERRAIQLGLRGKTLKAYGTEALLNIEDISAFVATQREKLRQGNLDALETPRERVYQSALAGPEG